MISTNSFDVFAQLDPPIWLLTCQSGQQRGGLIATFVNQASICPQFPRVIAGLARQHNTHELVEAKGSFVLHLLGEEQLDWVSGFGLQSSRNVNKFRDLQSSLSESGNPKLPGTLAWLDCSVEAKLDTGDRCIYLAEVTAAAHERRGNVLTLQRLLTLAPPEMKTELKSQMERDQAIDAEAISQWRSERTNELGNEELK